MAYGNGISLYHQHKEQIGNTINRYFSATIGRRGCSLSDADYYNIGEACKNARKLLVQLDSEADANEIRRLLGEITGIERS